MRWPPLPKRHMCVVLSFKGGEEQLDVHKDSTMKVTPETGRRSEMKTCEVVVMGLFDPNADEEKALCGEDSSANDRMGVDYYLEQRRDGLEVGTVCEACKALAVPFAIGLARDLEAEGRLKEADEHRQLAGTLLRETGLEPCMG